MRVFWGSLRVPNNPCGLRATTLFSHSSFFLKKTNFAKKKISKKSKKWDFEKSIFGHRFLIDFWCKNESFLTSDFGPILDPHFGPWFEGPHHDGSMSPYIRRWNQRFRRKGAQGLNFGVQNDPKKGQKWVQKWLKIAILTCIDPHFWSKTGKSRKWPFWGPKSSILGHFGVQNGSKSVILGHFGVQNRRFWVILGSKMRFSAKCHFWRFFCKKTLNFAFFELPRSIFGVIFDSPESVLNPKNGGIPF